MNLFLCKFMTVLIFIAWVLLTGCATSVGEGDAFLRQYPVPITFSVAEGATGNTQ